MISLHENKTINRNNVIIILFIILVLCVGIMVYQSLKIGDLKEVIEMLEQSNTQKEHTIFQQITHIEDQHTKILELESMLKELKLIFFEN